MKCPKCGTKLCGIAPLSSEEWKCDTCEIEYYGSTQKEVNTQRGLKNE